MNVRKLLTELPIGRWSELRTEEGVTSVYHCDTSAGAEDWYIVERPEGRKHRFTLNNAIGFFTNRML